MSRLIVKNLPKSITEDKLRELFSQKGDITDVQLKYTKDGKFRQFGFIGYRTEEQAKDAISFFDSTCIKTSKITVEPCINLGDSQKPKSWSKYANDSTAYKKQHPDEEKPKEKEKEPAKKEKKNDKIKELLEKYKDDPMFEEFMVLHGAKNATDILNQTSESKEETDLSENEDEDENAENKDSGHESTEENEEKLANQKISDFEYMKLLMKGGDKSESKPRKKMEKQPKEKIQLYTVKIRGLPYSCKKKDIKQFFNPIVPYTIRIPAKVKGFAYAGFKTEKTMNQALFKDKSFMAGKRIAVFRYTANENDETGDGNKTNSTKNNKWVSQEEALKNEEDIAESGRIFLRNLSYTTTENDIQELFTKFGPLAEINLPIDKVTRKLKGFGVITFLMPEHAVKAYTELDGSILHGRMLHLLPGKSKDVQDDINAEGLNYKQKKALKDKATAGSSHNWNSLFIGHNAVAAVIADQYGTSKEAVLDGRGKGSAAVRLALGETQVVAETREYLEEYGVYLDAFMQPASQRSKTVILVKNLPAHTDCEEIQNLFVNHGVLGRVLLPPNGVTAIVEFLEPSEARKAFMKLAYSKFKNTPLYLEWAPENTFKTAAVATNANKNNAKETKEGTQNKSAVEETKIEKTQESESEEENDQPEDDTTLYVKNISFDTTDGMLTKHFEKCGKINYATVALKKDPQNPGQTLSMGYAFIRFQLKAGADKALKTLQQSNLDGRNIEIKRSERTLKTDIKVVKKTSKVTKQTGSKIMVRNIPFQANKNEVHELFKAFGEIKALRLPKKMSLGQESHRGFCFVDYVSKSDAKKAFKALSQSTHLYGRRLVLEWASTTEDGVDEIRKRTAKHFHPTEEVRSKKSVLDADTVMNNE